MQPVGRVAALLAMFAAGASSAACNADDAAACPADSRDAATEAAQEDADQHSLLQVARGGAGDAGSVGGSLDEQQEQDWWGHRPPADNFKAKVLPVPDGKIAGGDKLNFGACISGGGNRAFTWTLGIFRALSELGFMDFDAISGVSGGAWISSLYTFAEGSDGELLGKPTHPKQLSVDFLEQYHTKFGQRAVDATNGILLNVALRNYPHNVWQRFIGEAYLKPFGLDDQTAYMAGSEEDVARIKQRNPALKRAKFVVQRSDRKYQWRAMCTMLGPVNYVPSSRNVVSFEVMPSWTGLPGHPNGSMVTYEPLQHSGKAKLNHGDLSALVGGGFVETFAFGGAVPEEIPQDVGQMIEATLPAPAKPFTLADALGISSLAVSARLANGEIGELADPRSWYWPIPGEEFFRQKALLHEFGDGGSIDNSGLLSLLLRSTQHVLWVASSFQALNMSYDWEGACAQRPTVDFDPVAAGIIDSVMDKFGYGDKVTTPETGYYLSQNQVFEKAALVPLSCDLWHLVKDGEPAVVEFTEKVLPNTWWQIKGGYDVKVLILYLAPSWKFTEQLPNCTKQELAKGSDGAFANYPNFKTQFQNGFQAIAYTKPQVNLLSAQAEWSVKRASRKIGNFFGKDDC